MTSHTRTLRAFARKLSWLLLLRRVVRWATVWFFLWGVAVLACRFSGVLNGRWLLAGLLGVLPLAAFAALLERRRRSGFSKIRATYDGFNQCGGLIMAEEVADMAAWRSTLPQPASPKLRWRGGRSWGVLGLSAVFVAVTLWLPDRLTTFAARRPLQIGKLVGELHAEVQTLKQEKILKKDKADELQKQLARLKEQSSALDPNKTWEALDHIKQSNADLARQAAEEALSKTTSLTEAETLAAALDKASASGLNQATATQAAQDLAAMLKSAKLENGLLKGKIPPELLASTSGLSQEELNRLLQAIQFNKSHFGQTVTNLANLKLIDPKWLAKCSKAGQCRNPGALAAFLSQCTNGCNSLAHLAISYCRGGLDRGRGDAPMTWKEETSDAGAKFKEHVLPPSSRLADSQFIGVSRAAPELSSAKVVAQHGALAGAQAGGGAANAQVILPEHRQAVRNFFKREGK